MLFAPSAQHVTKSLGVSQQQSLLKPTTLAARCSSDKIKANNITSNNHNNSNIALNNHNHNKNKTNNDNKIKSYNISFHDKNSSKKDTFDCGVVIPSLNFADYSEAAALSTPADTTAQKAITSVQQTTKADNNNKVERLSEKNEDDVMEAMRKLDNELVAYLECGGKGGMDTLKTIKKHHHHQRDMDLMPDHVVQKMHEQHNDDFVVVDDEEEEELEEVQEEDRRELFKSMSIIKLHMEALTLQACGIKNMALAQSEVRPIFTIECRLSPELIKQVPRYDMFHIMQFESEKFNSLTQCTRFGQDARRQVRLLYNENNNNNNDQGKNLNFGRIHITVWWREPGTCFNEMLGMGVLELSDLYNAGTLEQCKCIAITRRNVHLVNIYMKISIFTDEQQQSKMERRLRQVTTFDHVRPLLNSHMAWKAHNKQQQQQQQLQHVDLSDNDNNNNNNNNSTNSTTSNNNNNTNSSGSSSNENGNMNNSNFCSTEAAAVVAVTESGNKYIVGVS